MRQPDGVAATIARAVAPAVADRGLDLYDVECSGSGAARVVRVTVAAQQLGRGEGSAEGVDIDTLAALTRTIEPLVDELVDGRYQLEVSSPGLDRTLRVPAHFVGACGERISVKYTDDAGRPERRQGTLVAVDAGPDAGEPETDQAVRLLLSCDDGATVEIDLEAVTAARTVFEWGPAPRPGKGTKPGTSKRTAHATTKERAS